MSPGKRGCYDHYLVVSGKLLTDRVLIASEMTKSVVDLIFYRIPSKPEEGKWTKTPPAVSWCANLSTVGSLFEDVVHDAFNHIKVDVVAPDGSTSGLSFHQVSGVRLLGARGLSTSMADLHKLRVLDLMLNSTRYLQMFFLRCSKEFHDTCQPCPMHDFYNPTTSQATVALQYLGYLATSGATHCRLLWEPLGYRNHAEFCCDDNEHTKFFRVSLYLTSVSLHRRHVVARHASDIEVALHSDARIPLDRRREVMDMLRKKHTASRHCCLQPIAFNMIEKFVLDVCNVLLTNLLRASEGLAWALAKAMSVVSIERRHLRNKRIVSMNSHFANLVSKGLAEERRNIAVTTARTMQAMVQGVGLLPPIVDHGVGQEVRIANAKQRSAWDCFFAGQTSRGIYAF